MVHLRSKTVPIRCCFQNAYRRPVISYFIHRIAPVWSNYSQDISLLDGRIRSVKLISSTNAFHPQIFHVETHSLNHQLSTLYLS